MDPHYEQLNERLAPLVKAPGVPGETTLPAARSAEDAQMDELVGLARRLQAAPQLRFEAGFAEMLERRLLRHALITRQQNARGRVAWQFWRRRRVAVLLSFSLLLLLFSGLGLLALAAQATSPANPFYGIRQWIQPVRMTQLPRATPTPDEATLDLQAARSRLAALLTLTAPAQTGAYVQALAQFHTRLTSATTALDSLAAGPEKTQLSTQLDLLKNEARQKLRNLLPILTSTASAATTSELGSLGESIPRVASSSIVLPARPKGNASVTIVGSGIQPGARLLVDGDLVQARGTLGNGRIVFVLAWRSEQHPHSLGIVNPDGTVAQTNNVTVTIASAGSQSGSQSGNQSGSQSGNRGEKSNQGKRNGNA